MLIRCRDFDKLCWEDVFGGEFCRGEAQRLGTGNATGRRILAPWSSQKIENLIPLAFIALTRLIPHVTKLAPMSILQKD